MTSSRGERILDAIDKWHMQDPHSLAADTPLHAYLGWTWEEYRAYVERGELPAEREGAL